GEVEEHDLLAGDNAARQSLLQHVLKLGLRNTPVVVRIQLSDDSRGPRGAGQPVPDPCVPQEFPQLTPADLAVLDVVVVVVEGPVIIPPEPVPDQLANLVAEFALLQLGSGHQTSSTTS